jgi:D-alanyl-D-alanine carboxypeptidase
MRKFVIILIVLMLNIWAANILFAAPRAISYIAIDAKTGKTLVQKDPIQERHPASLVKMMTIYMLFDALDRGKFTMDSKLMVSKNAASKPASKLYVTPNRPISVTDAIDALIIKSANDVATVVAENIAGSEDEFAVQMNSTAKQLGMYATTFKNASGLHHDNQVTTTYDMALLALALQDRFPNLYKRFSKKKFVYGNKSFQEYNPMLGSVVGVDGLKTGFTNRSGFNLATNRVHNNQHVIAIVMGASSSKERSKLMISVLKSAKKIAFQGSRKIGKLNKKTWIDPIHVSWIDGAPLAAFGNSSRNQSIKVTKSTQAMISRNEIIRAPRGSNLRVSIKPNGVHLLPDDFYAKDQETLAIMLRDLSSSVSQRKSSDKASIFADGVGRRRLNTTGHFTAINHGSYYKN